MQKNRLSLREKYIFSFLYVVLTSLVFSVTFSYVLLIVNINRKLDPQLNESLKIIEKRFFDLKETNLIYSDIVSKDEDVLRFLKGEALREEAIDSLIRINGKIGVDLLQVLDSNGVVLIRIEDLKKYGDSKFTFGLIKEALAGKKATTVRDYESVGALNIVAASPIEESGKVYGILVTGYVINNQLLYKLRGSLDEEVTIFNNQGNLMATTFVNSQGVSIS
ncbi:hypothetical protein HY419_00285, partial [candidate division WWE3 bacterium]|nr:hypothetical protein [candidate division WWE3 bacterium]